MQINSAKDLMVYKAAYELAMKVFELSKVSARGEVWTHKSNPTVIAFGMFEFA